MLAHVPTNIVLSENGLAEQPAHRCPQCSPTQRVNMVRDLLPLFGINRLGHTHMFFKFQDATSIQVVSLEGARFLLRVYAT